MAKYRWECPNGEHAGALAPARMRRDDARRYCLECTAATGRLIERVSPVLERRKQAAAERAERKRARRQEVRAERRRRRKDPIKLKATPDGMDVVLEYERLQSLECWAEWGVGGAVQRTKLQVYGGRSHRASGHFQPDMGRIHVTAGSAPGWHVSLVLLHELVHAAHWGRGFTRRGAARRRFHDEAFHLMLLRAAAEAYSLPASVQDEVRAAYAAEGGPRRAYSMDRALEQILAAVGDRLALAA